MAKKKPITDLILRRQLNVESYGAGVARDQLADELSRAVQELEDTLYSYSKDNFTRSRYVAIQREILKALAELSASYPASIDKARLAVIQDDYDKFTRIGREAADKTVKAAPYRLPLSQTKAMLSEPIGGQYLSDWVDNHMAGIRGQLRRELTQSVIQGETNRQAAARLRTTFDMSRRGADMIARTAMNSAANVARERALEPFSDVIMSWKVLGTLDVRTCAVCAEWDGQVADKREDLPQFPLHPNCRCVVIPIIDEDEETGTRAAVFEEEAHTVEHTKKDPVTGKRIKDGTTSTKWDIVDAGQVSARTTFTGFFERQPEAWKRQYLGAGRYELYKQGKLGLADLSKNNRVLTLKELRASL